MRRTSQTRRQARRDASPGLSMFPFLAVLICTIGSLVVLLVVITRQARIQAAIAAKKAAAEAQRDVVEKREMAQWRIEQLEHSRTQTLQQVADLRNTLGHLEDHSRALEEELRQLKRTWETLAQGEDSLRKADIEAQLERIRTEIRQAEQKLADAEQKLAAQPPSYAIVPYQGPGETRRRPIYIECRKDAVILQPEGIVLREEDFEGPNGPGNPLAAALRAKREYLLSYGNLDPREAGEPYPLLIVRENGIAAYYLARDAMTSWGAEFGYELVDADWKVEFQQPDPQLAALLRQTIDAARMRQERLIAAAPRHYGSQGSQVYYRAAPGGGIVVDGGERGESVRPSPRYGRRGGNADSRFDRAGGAGAERAFDTPGGETSPPGRETATGLASGTRADAPARSAGSDSRENDIRGYGSPQGSGGNENSSLRFRSGADNRSQQANGGVASPPSGDISEQSGIVGSARSLEAGRDGTAADTQATGRLATGSERQSNGQPQSQPLGLGQWQDPQSLRPVAEKKGQDWALPDASRRATPITRPIRVECHADRLVLPAPSGVAGGQLVPFRESTADSVQPLVAAIRDVIDAWGIAGRDMYWSPVLKVRVAPGAEYRYQELEVLLRNSGLALERS